MFKEVGQADGILNPANANRPPLHASDEPKIMTHRTTLTLLASLIFATQANSQQKQTEYKIDSILSKCLSKNQTTAGMTDCLIKTKDLWDKELNKYYKLLNTQLDSTGQKRLKEAQRQWIIYRDKEIELISEIYGKRDGSMWNIVTSDKINQLIRQRAVDLIEYYETLTQN